MQHYGHIFSYMARSIDWDRPAADFPMAFQPVLERVVTAAGMLAADQLTVNEYTPGVGLSAHVDTHSAFADTMASLSLAGPAVMEFRRGCETEVMSCSLQHSFEPAPSLSPLSRQPVFRYRWPLASRASTGVPNQLGRLQPNLHVVKHSTGAQTLPAPAVISSRTAHQQQVCTNACVKRWLQQRF